MIIIRCRKQELMLPVIALLALFFQVSSVAPPVVYYPFVESEGTSIRDFSGNGHHAWHRGCSWLVEADGPTTRLIFENSCYVSIPVRGLPDFLSSDGWTVSFWTIVSDCPAPMVPFTGWDERGNLLLYAEPSWNCDLNRHHWALAWDSKSPIVQIYQDGIVIEAETKNIQNPEEVAYFKVGRTRVGDEPYNGSIEEFAMFPQHFSVTDIQAIYRNLDECRTGVHTCATSALECLDTPGSFVCGCFSRPYADGFGATGCAGLVSSIGPSGGTAHVRRALSLPTPIVWYDMDEGVGTVLTDQSGGGCDGTVLSQESWVSAQYGYGLSFDGASDYVAVPAACLGTLSTEVTITFWASDPTASQANAQVLGGDGPFRIKMPTNFETVEIVLGTDALEFSPNMGPGLHHWAFTKDAATGVMEIYVDAVLVASSTENTVTLPLIDALHLGAAVEQEDYWTGILDDFRIYDVALTIEEVALVMCDSESATCPDVNECFDGIDSCGANSTCLNSLGSFSCVCLADFYGDGLN
eukprot:Rmarinus@m.26281